VKLIVVKLGMSSQSVSMDKLQLQEPKLLFQKLLIFTIGNMLMDIFSFCNNMPHIQIQLNSIKVLFTDSTLISMITKWIKDSKLILVLLLNQLWVLEVFNSLMTCYSFQMLLMVSSSLNLILMIMNIQSWLKNSKWMILSKIIIY